MQVPDCLIHVSISELEPSSSHCWLRVYLDWPVQSSLEKLTSIIKLTVSPLDILLDSMEITQIEMKKKEVKVKINVHKMNILGYLLKNNARTECPQGT